MRKSAYCALALLYSGIAFAADAPPGTESVSVLRPVTFSVEAPAPEWIRQECQLEQHVLDDLHEALADRGLGGAILESPGEGLALKVTIERVVGQRGGGWSGPKTLSLGIALLRGGKVMRTTSQTSATKSLNPMADTCASFERASSKVSDLVVGWLLPGRRTGVGAIALSHAAPAASAPRE
ncbi:MAG: hypothetical protein ACJ8IK_06240 [Burkholderiaceae bacterium]|jgi:hypothetical protein